MYKPTPTHILTLSHLRHLREICYSSASLSWKNAIWSADIRQMEGLTLNDTKWTMNDAIRLDWFQPVTVSLIWRKAKDEIVGMNTSLCQYFYKHMHSDMFTKWPLRLTQSDSSKQKYTIICYIYNTKLAQTCLEDYCVKCVYLFK